MTASFSGDPQAQPTGHADAGRHRERLGEPEHLAPRLVEESNRASGPKTERIDFHMEGGESKLGLTMPPQAVAAVHFRF